MALVKNLFGISILAMASITVSACADSNAQSADRFASVKIKTETLGDHVAVLFGSGGNIGVIHGEDGTVLIDDQFAPLTTRIQQAVAALEAAPAGYVINTHWHGDHSGGNENFGKAGALIMAHDNVRIRMLGKQPEGRGNDPASPKAALPVVTYADGVKLHLNGNDVHIIHVPTGHTDGDSLVYVKQDNVLHMGDTFFHQVTLPFIDLNSGGNALGILASAEKGLELANEDTKIIPGHGPVATRADLVAYRDMMNSVISAVRTARAEGKSLAEIQAMKPAAQWDTNPDAFIKGDAFVEAVYKSLEARDQ